MGDDVDLSTDQRKRIGKGKRPDQQIYSPGSRGRSVGKKKKVKTPTRDSGDGSDSPKLQAVHTNDATAQHSDTASCHDTGTDNDTPVPNHACPSTDVPQCFVRENVDVLHKAIDDIPDGTRMTDGCVTLNADGTDKSIIGGVDLADEQLCDSKSDVFAKETEGLPDKLDLFVGGGILEKDASSENLTTSELNGNPLLMSWSECSGANLCDETVEYGCNPARLVCDQGSSKQKHVSGSYQTEDATTVEVSEKTDVNKDVQGKCTSDYDENDAILCQVADVSDDEKNSVPENSSLGIKQAEMPTLDDVFSKNTTPTKTLEKKSKKKIKKKLSKQKTKEEAFSVSTKPADINQSAMLDVSGDVLTELDDWESSWNDAGDCVDRSLITKLEKLTTIADPIVHKVEVPLAVLDQGGIDQNMEDCDHIIEICGFPSDYTTSHLALVITFMGCKDYELKWVNDTSALVIFPSKSAAASALARPCAFAMLHAIGGASKEAKEKAKLCRGSQLPFKPRPTTSAHVARNLVANALGINANVSREQRLLEREKLQKAKEAKAVREKQKRDVWDED